VSAIRAIDLPATLQRTDEIRERTPAREAGGAAATGSSFAASLADAVSQARHAERSASEAAAGFAAGDPGVGIHEVVIASEKANISLRYATTLKNKLLDSYRELMNTQV